MFASTISCLSWSVLPSYCSGRSGATRAEVKHVVCVAGATDVLELLGGGFHAGLLAVVIEPVARKREWGAVAKVYGILELTNMS